MIRSGARLRLADGLRAVRRFGNIRYDAALFVLTGDARCRSPSSNPALKDLYDIHGDDIDFIMLHVREAHPGETWDQPDAYERKIEHARALKRRDRLPWPVVVDDPEGSLHRKLDEKPNAVYLTDRRGAIVYRGLWAGDDKGLSQALESAAHDDMLRRMESQRRFKPMAMGVGMMREMTLAIRTACPGRTCGGRRHPWP